MSASGDDPKLPEDIVVEVLKRLPVASLLRFRCVCRSWRSSVDDPRFVALHLNHSSLDASNWHIVCDADDGFCSLFPHVSLTLSSKSRIQMPFATRHCYYNFVGSCNGLICVKQIPKNGCDSMMYLWNLFTRKYRAIPLPGTQHKSLCRGTALVVLGFGFDAKRDDYKIVRISFCPACHSRCFGRTKSSVEIYSLRTDSWRSLEREVTAFCAFEPAVFFSGNLHWLAFEFDGPRLEAGHKIIVSFNVAGEMFDVMALPEEMLPKDGEGSIVSVAVLNDLLAVFTNSVDSVGHCEPSVCSVWVMMEHGLPESWTKLYTFEACAQVLAFDGFTKIGELMMEIDTGEQVSLDPITGQYTDIPRSTELDLVTIVGSLVSPYSLTNDSVAATLGDMAN